MPGLWKYPTDVHISEVDKCQGLKKENPDNKTGENDREVLDVRNVIAQVGIKKKKKKDGKKTNKGISSVCQ